MNQTDSHYRSLCAEMRQPPAFLPLAVLSLFAKGLGMTDGDGAAQV
jgi:hypothetical protein